MKELEISTIPLSGMNLIEASAGTGKTYTISNLYLRFILEQQLDVRETLVVTFTEAATKELKERIRGNLSRAWERLEELQHSGESADLNSNDAIEAILATYLNGEEERFETGRRLLRRAVVNFDEAAVFTIHGFCQRMLNENAFESKILFDLELVESDLPVLQQAVDDFWRTHFYHDNELLTALARKQKISRNSLLELASAFTSDPELQVSSSISEDEMVTREEVDLIVGQMADSWKGRGDSILARITTAPIKKNQTKEPYKEEHLELYKKAFEALAKGRFSSELPDSVAALNSDQLLASMKKNKEDEVPQDEFFDLCKSFDGVLERWILSLKLEFIHYIREEVPNLKAQKNIQCFDDILLNLQRALKSDETGKFTELIRSKYRAAMIDEFQDTNPVQYDIFTTLFKGYDEATLFMIGDPKQSIYGFRGADVFSYLQAAGDVPEDKRYTLGHNFRSEERMIEGVNAWFDQGRSSEEHPFTYSEISFSPVAYGAKPGKRKLMIDGEEAGGLLCRQLPMKDNMQLYTTDEAQQLVNQSVAAEISSLLNQSNNGKACFVDEASGEGKEPIRPGDIAILVNTHRQARVMQQELQLLGIPSVMQSSGNLLNAEEATEMLRLLQVISDPSERLARPALATRLLGVTADQMTAENEELIINWLERFVLYHHIWHKSGFIVMFRQFIVECSIRERLLSYAGGERALTNILHLAELLHQQSRAGDLGVEGLVLWLKEQVTSEDTENKPEYEIRLESDDRAVQFVTVHKSKGLEYPIVFCPFIWNRRFVEGIMSAEKDFRFYNSDENRQSFDIGSDKRDEHRLMKRREELAESLRLLYVAMTRAGNRCYLDWGPIAGIEQTAMIYMTQQPDVQEFVASGGSAYLLGNTRKRELYDDRLEALVKRFDDLVATSNGTVSAVEVIDADPQVYVSSDYEKTPDLQARAFSSDVLEKGWGVGSFSWLTRFASHSSVIYDDKDHDEETEADEEKITGEGFFSFPRGADVGSSIHEVFENIEFAASTPDFRDRHKRVVRQKLHRFRIASGRTEEEYELDLEEKCQDVMRMIDNVLVAPITTDYCSFTLSDLPSPTRLPEMEFYYPLKSVSAQQLEDIFAEHGVGIVKEHFAQELGRLQFNLRKGFMHGFIDLCFEYESRYYVLDWKTNYLGDKYQAYQPDILAKCMSDSYYILQYHLYIVALHLFLKSRLPEYSYETHMGGAIYLYIRGMHPKREGAGIYTDRPSEALIEALCQEMCGVDH